MIRHRRPYRVARVGVALARALPRYLLLLARERWTRAGVSPAAWERAHAAAAREARRLALALAGAFTKAAQIGGARADVLPRAFIDELSRFHDAVPPRPFEALRPVLERDLGRPLGEAFAWVDPQPLAAASLAQVHRARLRDGREIVVKIQYPEVRRIIPLDLRMLRRVAGLIQRLQSLVDLRTLVHEVTRFVELELDFEHEVTSVERLRRTLASHGGVRVPAVHRELCGPNVVVLEYLEGIPLSRLDAVDAAGHARAKIARRVGALYGSMIFEHGFFQGDPHPGNLLVLPDGRLGLLDFGLCKELPEGFARRVARMMVAAMIGDGADALAAAHELGFRAEALRAEHLRSLMLQTLGDSDGEAGTLEILAESRIRRIPEDFALVLRTLILLNGLSHRLAPRRRLVQAELLQHLAAGAARETRPHVPSGAPVATAPATSLVPA